MITRKILVIDDDEMQARALAETVMSIIPNSRALPVWNEEDILMAIDNRFFNLAILDIRMDNYKYDGFDLADRIIQTNPYARILLVSRYRDEYASKLAPMMMNGNILGFSDKNSDYDLWAEELKNLILPYYESLDLNPQSIIASLTNLYADLKDETNTFIKGEKFESFISLLFQRIGFSEVIKRSKDKSLNEVDLIVRNEIDDPFLSKFGKYILVECKNHLDKIDKNDFILFLSKLRNSNGLAELGFFITTSSFKRTVYLEAIRSSEGKHKIVFLDNANLLRLIKSEDPREELKRIIDLQVKDN